MSPTATTTETSETEATEKHLPSVQEVDESCRSSLFILLGGAALWLVLGSLFGFLASIKFHAPPLFADVSWLTLGRVDAAAFNLFLYGFAVPAGLSVLLWQFARLGRTEIGLKLFIGTGSVLWHLGVFLGMLAVLAGENSGYRWLEFPGSVVFVLLLAYAILGGCLFVQFVQRNVRPLYVSQWFLLAGLFWLPWILITVYWMLLVSPVRGTLQSVVHWWYGNNLAVVALGFMAIATLLYLLPVISKRELHSRWQAIFGFWILVIFAGWGGIPHGSPVPAWIPSLSTVGTVFALVGVAAIGMNLHFTFNGQYQLFSTDIPTRFLLVGAFAFPVGGLWNAVGSLEPVTDLTRFTLFTVAAQKWWIYGFVSMTFFGAVYYFLPKVCARDWWKPNLVQWHFLIALAGLILFVIPMAIGGLVQGAKLADAETLFMESLESALMFFRIATLGELAFLAGHVLFLVNVCGICCPSCCLPGKGKGKGSK